jgi:hypothetical protein
MGLEATECFFLDNNWWYFNNDETNYKQLHKKIQYGPRLLQEWPHRTSKAPSSLSFSSSPTKYRYRTQK